MTASTYPFYPVHVDARLDPHLSRGLWLVKWLLVIPHYVVLLLLWTAFAVLSVVAFVAILVTGRYPRAIFEFNVGVLRWSWRVAYYAYGALGTDRYPPFTLADRPDYPAQLDVDYPEHLSRGLVLVKWWLLALPHYLVLALFLGGGAYLTWDTTARDQDLVLNTGLIGLLVLVAGFVLLFTGRYPRPVFDFVLGMNRWVLRVAGYAALMTDRYPPFRLDQGGRDPGATLSMPHPAAPATPLPGSPPEPRPQWTAGRVVSLVAGAALLLASVGFLLPGAVLAVADSRMRDDAGFLMTDGVEVTTAGHAVVSDNLEVHTDVTAVSLPRELLGDAKVTAAPDGAGPVFVGIARTGDVDAYLRDVAHAVVVELGDRPRYDNVAGAAPGLAPADLDIWAASASGTGTQEMTWPVDSGDWTLVVMNADGSAGVTAELAVGAEVPALGWLVPLLLSVGGTLLVVGLVLVVVPVRAASRG